MSKVDTDRELLEATFRTYNEEFAPHVGEIVTPREYVETTDQIDWLARIFMFAYALGSIAGVEASTGSGHGREPDLERVESIVDTVVSIHESDDHEIHAERIRRDFLRE